MDKEKIIKLIDELKQYDNSKGYKLKIEEVRRRLEPVIKELVSRGNEAIDLLHRLLNDEKTWSSVFSLEILKEIKSEKSIRYLIDYIVKNEKGDYGNGGEEAMFTLTSIGKPAIEPLIKEIKNQFEKKIFHFYLTGALTEIKSDEVYKFMKEITEDYIKNEEKYDEWFHIDAFIHDFDNQEKKEIIPLLKNLLELDRISKHERIEIRGTIEIIEDRVGYEQRMKEEIERLRPLVEKSMKGKWGSGEKIEKKGLENRMWTPEDNLEIQFKCENCRRKQNINPGIIRVLGEDPPKFSFENEIMCKFCFSNDLKPTIQGRRDIMFQAIGTLEGYRNGVVSAKDNIYVENKLMLFKESYSYILKRIGEEPKNAELYIRAGNIAKNFNKYSEAIKHYEKAIELNPKLIEAYLNLVVIYEFRYKYYEVKDAKTRAIFYLDEMMDLFRTQNFEVTTIKDKGRIVQFLGEKSDSLGVYFPELVKIPLLPEKEKVGRNDPCPCGSGKKYKKCCLDKEIQK